MSSLFIYTHVQEQNGALNQRVMDMETETLQLQQHISKVDHQNTKLTEVSELNLFMLLSNMI